MLKRRLIYRKIFMCAPWETTMWRAKNHFLCTFSQNENLRAIRRQVTPTELTSKCKIKDYVWYSPRNTKRWKERYRLWKISTSKKRNTHIGPWLVRFFGSSGQISTLGLVEFQPKHRKLAAIYGNWCGYRSERESYVWTLSAHRWPLSWATHVRYNVE